MTTARPDRNSLSHGSVSTVGFRADRGRRTLVALLLALVVALGGAAGAWAAAPSIDLDAPIRAFGWPAEGPPDDPYFGLQSDLSTIGLASAWTRTTGSPDVVVAVLDTGIDASNPEFAGRIVPGYNALTGLADGPGDFAPTADDAGHGTHVSGTIAAAANNGTGIAGIAPSVSIMPIKVLSSDGEGDFEGLVAGMSWAIAHGARIITMSLGGTLDPPTVAYLQRIFDTAYAAGAVVVAASGNDGSTVNQYPCNFSHVICVGSTTADGAAVSSFSTRTAGLALVAPGERIASTLPRNAYGFGSGTSMATPHVTGAIALLRSLRPTLTPDEVLADLTQTARPLTAGGRNPDSGYGLLQVGAAIDLAAGSAKPTATPNPSASPTPNPGASPIQDPGLGPTPTPGVVTPGAIAPEVTTSSPANGTRNVSRDIRPRIDFSVPMAAVSTRTITMRDLSRGRRVAIRVGYNASTGSATIIPVRRLAANHSYRISVDRVVAASDGASLSRAFIVTFRTGYR